MGKGSQFLRQKSCDLQKFFTSLQRVLKILVKSLRKRFNAFKMADVLKISRNIFPSVEPPIVCTNLSSESFPFLFCRLLAAACNTHVSFSTCVLLTMFLPVLLCACCCLHCCRGTGIWYFPNGKPVLVGSPGEKGNSAKIVNFLSAR